VQSLIADTSRPVARSDLIAASRPGPGPRTHASTFFTPSPIASRAAVAAACCAANGVLFREPLYPSLPGLDHVMMFPSLS